MWISYYSIMRVHGLDSERTYVVTIVMSYFNPSILCPTLPSCASNSTAISFRRVAVYI